MLNRRNNNQTNRQQTSIPISKTLAAPTNDNSTTIMSNERKLSLASEGLQRYVKDSLTIRTSKENALTISEYVLLLKREINPSQSYKKIQIQALVELSDYLKQKPFKQLTTEDISSFLDKFRKTEDKDPLHKWIGTYNLKREILRQFFTWLNDPFTDLRWGSQTAPPPGADPFTYLPASSYAIF
jgi:hypothetical protein